MRPVAFLAGGMMAGMASSGYHLPPVSHHGFYARYGGNNARRRLVLKARRVKRHKS